MLKKAFVICLFALAGATAAQANGMGGPSLGGGSPMGPSNGPVNSTNQDCDELVSQMNKAADMLEKALEDGFGGWASFWIFRISNLGNAAIEQGCFQ